MAEIGPKLPIRIHLSSTPHNLVFQDLFQTGLGRPILMVTYLRRNALKSTEFMLLVVAQSCMALILPSLAAYAQDFSLPARQADFKTFVQEFENNYAYLDRTEKPWLSWERRYAEAVQQAESKEAYDAVLASALGELHDFHAEVRSPLVDRWLPVPTFADVWAEFEPSGAVVTAVRRGSDAEREGIHAGDRITSVGSVPLEKAIAARLTPSVRPETPQAREWALLSVLTGRSDEPRVLGLTTPAGRSYTVTLPVERHFDRPPGELSLQRLPGNVALIRFNNSLGEQKPSLPLIRHSWKQKTPRA